MKLPTRFGRFGGTFVPEILLPALEELAPPVAACPITSYPFNSTTFLINARI